MAPFHTVHGTFHVIIEDGGDGYLMAEVVGLPGCRTQAKTREELMERVKEAIHGYLEAFGEESRQPGFIGVEKVEV